VLAGNEPAAKDDPRDARILAYDGSERNRELRLRADRHPPAIRHRGLRCLGPASALNLRVSTTSSRRHARAAVFVLRPPTRANSVLHARAAGGSPQRLLMYHSRPRIAGSEDLNRIGRATRWRSWVLTEFGRRGEGERTASDRPTAPRRRCSSSARAFGAGFPASPQPTILRRWQHEDGRPTSARLRDDEPRRGVAGYADPQRC